MLWSGIFSWDWSLHAGGSWWPGGLLSVVVLDGSSLVLSMSGSIWGESMSVKLRAGTVKLDCGFKRNI